ncbi:MAG: flagellar hook-basal body complex protein FliE [Bryobacterales bacterium]|nr:flagellar hook-basal body complex protein FliE [Bryobacteraceae bacterium]MDW8129566.1 flagellar hook-basal body complex protein FliE [Bryobacterales bacterium]
MPEAIRPISSPVTAPESPGSRRTAADFAAVLKQAVERVEGMRRQADESVLRLLAGENEEVHQTVLAVQKAELAFELFLEVRNKVVQAYQEIMRMPI